MPGAARHAGTRSPPRGPRLLLSPRPCASPGSRHRRRRARLRASPGSGFRCRRRLPGGAVRPRSGPTGCGRGLRCRRPGGGGRKAAEAGGPAGGGPAPAPALVPAEVPGGRCRVRGCWVGQSVSSAGCETGAGLGHPAGTAVGLSLRHLGRECGSWKEMGALHKELCGGDVVLCRAGVGASLGDLVWKS